MSYLLDIRPQSLGELLARVIDGMESSLGEEALGHRPPHGPHGHERRPGHPHGRGRGCCGPHGHGERGREEWPEQD